MKAWPTLQRLARPPRARRLLSSLQPDRCPRREQLTEFLSSDSYDQRAFLAKLYSSNRPIVKENDIEPPTAASSTSIPDAWRASLHDIFQQSDVDESGALELTEVPLAIRAVMAACPIARSVLIEETAFRHFERADLNHDGRLSFDEFLGYIANTVLRTSHERLQQRERSARQRRTSLSDNALLEARVQELVPGIDDRGMHANRLLLGHTEQPTTSDAIKMDSNDYLRLNGHPTITAIKAEAMLREGMGDSHSRVHTYQRLDRHRALELRLAALLSAEDAALTMSGHHACLGLMRTLCAADTPVYTDAFSWCGSSLHSTGSAAGVGAWQVFKHNCVAHLSSLAHARPGIIAVDALYTDGSVAPLKEMVEMAEATGSVLVVDETHSFGCAAGGLGICEELGISERVHFRTIGFSKALASRGGIVIGPSRVLEAFRFNDSQSIFSTKPLLYEIVGFDATLDVLLQEEWRRQRLGSTHAAIKSGLLGLGYGDYISRSDRQIVSVVTDSDAATVRFRDACISRGVHGAVFVPPAAPEGRSFVRFSCHAEMSDAEVDRFIQTLGEAKGALDPR